MSNGPKFEELVDYETTGPERERLQRVHALLVEAGPPPELTPRLEKAPEVAEPGDVRELFRRPVKHRGTLLLAAALAVLAVFFGGYLVGHGRTANSQVQEQIALRGTPAAPQAQAQLTLLPVEQGNWPMRLQVSGLPPLHGNTVYEVYLVRDGKPWASCGTFSVTNPAVQLSVPLNAPYRLQRGDSWIVTREAPGATGPGPTVLKPVTT